MDNILGERLKKLRMQKEKLQKDIANYLSITTSAYGYYEKGERQPNPEMLLKLAEYFNVTTDYLLGRTDIPNNDFIKDIDSKITENNLHIAANSKVDLGKLAKLDNKTAKLINTLIDDFLNDNE